MEESYFETADTSALVGSYTTAPYQVSSRQKSRLCVNQPPRQVFLSTAVRSRLPPTPDQDWISPNKQQNCLLQHRVKTSPRMNLLKSLPFKTSVGSKDRDVCPTTQLFGGLCLVKCTGSYQDVHVFRSIGHFEFLKI